MAGPSRYFAVGETPAFSLLVTEYEKQGHSALRADLAWLNDKLKLSPETMGDRPPQLQKLRLPIYKTRCKDSCHGIGQSGGWRVYTHGKFTAAAKSLMESG